LKNRRNPAPLKTKGCGTHGQTKSLCGKLAQWYHPSTAANVTRGKRVVKGAPLGEILRAYYYMAASFAVDSEPENLAFIP